MNQSDTVTVLSFNILYGGDEYDFSKTVEAIKRSGAQIVCIQEAEGQLTRLADSLGWKHVNTTGHIISQFPLFYQPGREWFYTVVMPAPDRVFAISNIHLPSDPYGPEAVRDGMEADRVLLLEEEVRLPMLHMYLPVWDSLLAQKIPLVITGDLNSPSHLDWTSEAIGKRPQMRYAFRWPVTVALENAGLIDHYRAVNPDPVKNPGCTWTPGYPYPQINPGETHDRIDYIFGSSDITPLTANLIGENNNPEVLIKVDPYPTDHRGVLVSMVMVGANSWNGLKACGHQQVSIGNPSLTTEKQTYSPGTPIKAKWNHAGGYRYDWVALYPEGADGRSDYYKTDQQSAYLLWDYTFAKPSGSLLLDKTSHCKLWPLKPGRYTIHLMVDDGFESIAETTITIQ